MSDGLVREPWWGPVVQDAVRLGCLLLLGAVVVAAVVGPPVSRSWWLEAPARAFAALSAELLMLMLLRAVLPRAKPGAHRIGWNRSYLTWLASSAFNDVARLSLVRGPFIGLHATRVLYLRALGARVPWTTDLPSDLVVRDPSLWSIGAGAQLEPGVVVECAQHGAGRVRVGRVDIGDGTLVGAHTVILPGVVVAHDVRVGPRVVIGEESQVGVGVTLGPGVVVGRKVDVGSYVTVGPGAILGPSVVLGDRARVADGAVVAADTRVPERAHWPESCQENGREEAVGGALRDGC